ncbi:MAG: glycoside hydrolase family 92 protein [Marinilabiliales bacterium]|nr:glycoside hydrolase family 92 protein [Marinilabiliales bacterium]
MAEETERHQGLLHADTTTLKVFYTALYHTMIAPNLYTDADNRYRGTDGEIHASADFTNYTVFSLWDTYRAAHPLFTITVPELVPDFMNTMLSNQGTAGQASCMVTCRQ